MREINPIDTPMDARLAMSCLEQVCQTFPTPGLEFDGFSSAMLFVLNRTAASQSRMWLDEYWEAHVQWIHLFSLLNRFRERKMTLARVASSVFDPATDIYRRGIAVQVVMPSHGSWYAPVFSAGAGYCVGCRALRGMVERGKCIACATEEHRARCGCDRWLAMENEIKRREVLWREQRYCSI